MTTASQPSGSASPVSTIAKRSILRGEVSVAPNVSEARSAMPSIAAASYAGEERSAQIGAAVTRPRASASSSSTTSSRSGTAASQAAIASAAGMSDRNGALRGTATA